MNFRTIIIRFLLLAVTAGALVACQQQPEPELSEAVGSTATSTSEPTQQPPPVEAATVTPTKPPDTPEPTLTMVPSATPTPLPDDKESSSFSVLNYEKESATPSTPQTGDSPEPTAASTPLPQATSEPTETPSAPKKSANSDPFSFDRLVTASELDGFTEQLEIIAWEMEEEIEWEYRLCRSFLGASWSINPNSAYNCVFVADPTPSLDQAASWFIDQEILSPTAVALEPSFTYEKGSLLYVDQYDNGQTVYDAFVIGDGVVYWASISVGTPGGYTQEDVTDAMGHVVEAALNDIAMVNLGRTNPVNVADKNWPNTYLAVAEEQFKSGEFTSVDANLRKGVEAKPQVAFEYFQEKISADPENIFALWGRAIAQTFLQNYEEASEDYSLAIELSGGEPVQPYLFLGRGLSYAFLGDTELAVADGEEALAMDPANLDARHFLGFVYRELGDYETALDRQIAGLRLDQQLPEDLFFYAQETMRNADLLASNSTNPEQIALVMEAFQLIESKVPEYEISAVSWNKLCWNASLWGYAEDVMYACELAVEMAPEDGWIRDSRGVGRTLTGDFSGAIEDFQYYVDWGVENDVSSESLELREEWILSLEAGSNPLDKATLERLRNE